MTAPALSRPRRLAHRVVRKPEWRHALGLTVVLARKNVKVRYNRTSLGMVWAVGQPLVQAAVLTFVFSRVFRGQQVEHFGLYVLSGVMPFSAVSQGLQQATGSVVDNAGLVKKVALPRLVFPVAAVLGTQTVFSVSLAVLLVLSGVEGELGVDVLLLLPALVLMLTLLFGAGILGSALYVRYRDVRFMIETGMLLLFYATPVFYTSDRLGDFERWQRLNPMSGLLSLFRGAIAGRPPDWTAIGFSASFAAVLLAVALVVFHRRAQLFADLT